MDLPSHDRLMKLFDEFADLPGGPDRDRQLKQRCAGDLTLERQLIELLRADEQNTMSDVSDLADGIVEFGADEAVPLSIGPYLVTRLVGQGGMAMVFEASHSATGRRYAVKLIRAFISSLRSRERLKLEAESLSRLGHPGIAKFHEAGIALVTYPSGVTARAPFIAMEFVDGIPIDRYVAESSPGVEPTIRLVLEALRALHHAHQQGVIHRDIKPSNLLVTRAGACKIVDFGVARLIDEEGRGLTRTGQVLGTLRYMSPEQALGNSSVADIRADVYSMGAILFELLSGQRFIDDPSHLGISKAIQNSMLSPKRLAQVTRNIPRDLDAIVGKALESDRDKRFGSAEAFANDLERYLSGHTVSARAPSRIEQGLRLVRRNKLAAGALATAMCAITVGMVVSLRQTELARQGFKAAQEESLRKSAALDGERAVTDTLSTILAAVDPQMDGRDAKLLDVTLHAADTVSTQFANQPLPAATLQLSLGRTLVSLGQEDRGYGLIVTGLKTREALLGPDHLLTIEARFERAAAAIYIGDDQKIAGANVAIEDFLRAFRNDPTRQLRGALVCSAYFSHFDKYDRAIAILESAVAVADKASDVDKELSADAKVDLAELLAFRRGDAKRALQLLRPTQRAIVERFGPDSGRSLMTSLSLGTVLTRAELPDESIGYLEPLPEKIRRVYGDSHWALVSCYSALGTTLGDLKRYDESIVAIDEALSCILRINPGLEFDRRALAIRARKADVLRRAGRADQAWTIANEVVRGLLDPDRGYGPYGRGLARAYLVVGQLLADRGQPQRALAYFRLAVVTHTHELGSERDSIERAVFMHSLGGCLLNLGQPENAAPYLREAARIYELRLDADSPRLSNIRKLIAQTAPSKDGAPAQPAIGMSAIRSGDIWLEAAEATLQEGALPSALAWAQRAVADFPVSAPECSDRRARAVDLLARIRSQLPEK